MESIKRLDQAINLARSIASDLWCYNKAKVKDGVRNEDLYERLQKEIGEGARWYRERVSTELDPTGEHFERALIDVLLYRAMRSLSEETQ